MHLRSDTVTVPANKNPMTIILKMAHKSRLMCDDFFSIRYQVIIKIRFPYEYE